MTTIEQILKIKQNQVAEFAKRGTKLVFNPKKTSDSIDGEFLRLINKSVFDELIVGYGYSNFIIGKNPLCWRGRTFDSQLNKIGSNTTSIDSLNDYNLFNPLYLFNIADSDIETIKVDGLGNLASAGLGPNFTTPINTDFSKAITIDPQLDYEITFSMKLSDIAQGKVTFGCYCYDKDNNQISPKGANTLTSGYYFFIDNDFNIEEEYIFVRGILYNSKQTMILDNQDALLDIGHGENLIMDEKTNKIIPVILFKGGSSPSLMYIQDIKVKPLVNGYNSNNLYIKNDGVTFINEWELALESDPTLFSFYKGSWPKNQINTTGLLNIYYKDNSDTYTQDEIEKITNEKLTSHLVVENFVRL